MDIVIEHIAAYIGVAACFAGIVATWTSLKKNVSDHERSLGRLEDRFEKVHKVEGRLDTLYKLEGKVEQDVEKLEGKVNQDVEKLEGKVNQHVDKLEGKVKHDVEKIDRKIDEKVEKLNKQFNEQYQSVGERLGMVWHVIYPHLSANESSVLNSVRDIVASHATRGNPIKKTDLDKFDDYREKVANKTLTEAEYEDFKKLSKAIENDLPPGEDKDKFSSLIQEALGFAAGVTFWSLSLPFGSKSKGKEENQ